MLLNWLTTNTEHIYNFPVSYTTEIYGVWLTTTCIVTSASFSVAEKSISGIRTNAYTFEGTYWPETCYCLAIGT